MDLQSTATPCSIRPEFWLSLSESNRGPQSYQDCALTTWAKGHYYLHKLQSSSIPPSWNAFWFWYSSTYFSVIYVNRSGVLRNLLCIMPKFCPFTKNVFSSFFPVFFYHFWYGLYQVPAFTESFTFSLLVPQYKCLGFEHFELLQAWHKSAGLL